MSAAMSKRERVERALACRETDRVPIYDLLRNDAAFAHFSGEPLPHPTSQAWTAETLGRIAGKAVDAFLDMTRSFGFGPMNAGETTDGFGFVWRHAPFEKTSWIVSRPFADERGAAAFLKDWIQHYRERMKTIEADSSGFRDQYHRTFLHTQGLIGDTVNLLALHGTGLDDINHRLGLELFSYVLADDPGLIAEGLEVYTAHNLAACHAIADPSLSPAVLTYGDIACKGRLMYTPEFLRREFFPRIRRLNDAWHEHGLKCLFHSDGYLMEVMDDLLESGIDGLNPLETVAGMSIREVREKCGQGLFLAGGIDMSQLLSNGSPEEVAEVCRQAIRDAGPGYFLGSTTEADNSCRLENLLAMAGVAWDGSVDRTV